MNSIKFRIDGAVREIKGEDIKRYIGKDGDGYEICEGDALKVHWGDMRKSDEAGFLASGLQLACPNVNAVLRFYYHYGRFELFWTMENRLVDTGFDWRDVYTYTKFFEVIRED